MRSSNQCVLLSFSTMPSDVDRLKRAFVSVLLRLAAAYGLDLRVTRESSDAEVRGAYRKLSPRR